MDDDDELDDKVDDDVDVDDEFIDGNKKERDKMVEFNGLSWRPAEAERAFLTQIQAKEI